MNGNGVPLAEATSLLAPTASFEKSELLDSFGSMNNDVSSSNNANGEKSEPSECSSGSINQTALNVAKMCMGTGTLALPFGASQGGLLLNILGLALVTMWNSYSVHLLVKCLSYIPPPPHEQQNQQQQQQNGTGARNKKRHGTTTSLRRKWFKRTPSDRIDIYDEMLRDEEPARNGRPPPNTATFGKVTWYAFGTWGLLLVDVIMLVLMFGIIIAYEDAVLGFMKDTPFTTGSMALDSIWIVLVIIPLSCVPNLKYLFKFSAFGIFVLFAIFLVIAGYGMKENGLAGFTQITRADMWPSSFTAASNWFGVVVFGYGIVPFTYNMQESMKEPEKITMATNKALWAVYAAYVIIGNGITIIFYPTMPQGFEGEVLQTLPNTWLPLLVRLCMVFVVIVTAPLVVVPTGQLIEGLLGFGSDMSYWYKAAIRVVVCLFCTCISVVVPDFVYVISVLGCMCVALVSFVLPPLLHLVLAHRFMSHQSQHLHVIASQSDLRNAPDMTSSCDAEDDSFKKTMLWVDVVLLTWGLFATVITSVLSFNSMMKQFWREQ